MQQKLIIMAPPYGLGSLIWTTCLGVWLARRLEKAPVIWWGASCLYSKSPGLNCYEHLFKPPRSAISHDYASSLATADGRIYPEYWQAVSPLSLQEMDRRVPPNDHYSRLDWKCADAAHIQSADVCVIHSYLSSREAWSISGKALTDFDEEAFDNSLAEVFQEFFVPSDVIVRAAEGLVAHFLRTPGYRIGVHYRGSDKVAEATVPSVQRHAIAARRLGSREKLLSFYLATDSVSGLAEMRRRLGHYGPITAQEIDRADSLVPLHYRKETAFQNAIDVGVDVELLSRCAAICGNCGSTVAWWVNNRRAALGISGRMHDVEPGLWDVFSTVLKFGKLFGVRRALAIAPHRIREWATNRLKRRGISRRRLRTFLNRLKK